MAEDDRRDRSVEPAPSDDLVMALLERALLLDDGARREFVERESAGDDALFLAVWGRIEAARRMQGFLLRPLMSPVLWVEEDLKPGELLRERFRIVRTVAHGGMAVVYEAWDERLEKRIALKCARPEFRRRISPEARSATEITHPNVCRVFELHSVERNGGPLDFITMELLKGETLAHRLLRGPLAFAAFLECARQLCSGLAEAHRRRIVHGDLKASNVIISAHGDGTHERAVITDFGLARAFGGDEVQAPSSAGTPDYMAPELWRGGSPSVRSDIYALGVLMHEMLKGVRPGSAHGAQQVASSRWPVQRRVERVIATCLARDPSARYESVEQVSAALAATHGPSVPRLVLIGVALVLAVSAGGWLGRWLTAPVTRTVAVLPFAMDPSAADSSQYLAEGMADSLIRSLAQFPGVSVIARSSSFAPVSKDATLAERASNLGAPYLVTGLVRRVGEREVASVELLDAAEGRHLWGGEFSLQPSSLASVESEIARHVAERIGVRLSATPTSTESEARSRAYELLLRGQYQRRLYTPDSRREAIGLFEQALVVDPSFALAHAELANTFRLLAGGGVLDPREAMPKADAEAQRALAADPAMAEAHAAYADVLKDRWRFTDAEREYRRAIELKPSLADAHMGYGILLSVMGRMEEALRETARVRELDPVGMPGALHAAAVLYNGRQFPEALTELDRATRLDPSAPSPWMWRGMVMAASGRFTDALAAYDRAMERDHTLATRAFRVYALGGAGRDDEARQELARIRQSGDFVPDTALAVAYVGVGDADSAVASLETAFNRPDPILQYLKVEPHYDSLKGRAEYGRLARDLGLP